MHVPEKYIIINNQQINNMFLKFYNTVSIKTMNMEENIHYYTNVTVMTM